MRFNMHGGCGPRRFDRIPEAILAMGMGGRSWSWGGGDWSDWAGGDGRGRGGRRRVFESGELRLVLLKLIADQPRHGYDLIRAIEELTHGTYAPSPRRHLSDADDAAGHGPHPRTGGGGLPQGLRGHR
jgi:hypothetical protein